VVKSLFSKLNFGRGGDGDDTRAQLSDGVWPRAEITAVLSRRYGQIEHIRDENGFALYGVSDHDVRFVVALVTAAGAEDQISEVGFIARFSGFEIGINQLEALNRNLHLSLAAIDTDGDIFLIGGVKAQGTFNEGSFSMVLESWRRDLALVIQGVTGGSSFLDAFPAARLEAVQAFATNTAPTIASAEAPEDGKQMWAGDMLSKFMGTERASFAPCEECGGRGKLHKVIARFHKN